ncbi:MAG: TlpA disulfide reductase family protein [Phycisphaerae bacterium]
MAMQRFLATCLLSSATALFSASHASAAAAPGAARPAKKPDIRTQLEQEFEALRESLDKALPEDPKTLRDPTVRAKVAPGAMPILQKTIECLERRARFDKSLVGKSAWYRVISLALGNDRLKTSLTTAAKSGDRNAKIQLAGSKVIVAADASQRKTAMEEFVTLLGTEGVTPPEAEAALQAVVYAGALSKEEIKKIADAVEKLPDKTLKNALDRATMSSAERRAALKGKPLVLQGKLLTGKPFSTDSLKGKVILVHFWASWCPTCRESLPLVKEVRNKHGKKGLMVVGVCCDREVPALRKFLAQNPDVNWPQLFDTAKPGWHELARQYGIEGIPAMFLIDKKGIVRSVNAQRELEKLVPLLVDE